MSYTVEQLKEIINESDTEGQVTWTVYYADDGDGFKELSKPRVETTTIDGYGEFVDMLSKDTPVTFPDGSQAFYVDQDGGEGRGEEYWYVWKLVEDRLNAVGEGKPQERHFKVDGHYASYSGGYYDEMYEVFPKQVTVTQWGEKA